MATFELVRANIFLPINDKTIVGVDEMFSRLIKDFHGVTHSVMNPPAFRGYWLQLQSSQPGVNIISNVIPDDIMWIIVDVDQRIDDPRIDIYFSELKKSIQDEYGETEIWIILHQGWKVI